MYRNNVECQIIQCVQWCDVYLIVLESCVCVRLESPRLKNDMSDLPYASVVLKFDNFDLARVTTCRLLLNVVFLREAVKDTYKQCYTEIVTCWGIFGLLWDFITRKRLSLAARRIPLHQFTRLGNIVIYLLFFFFIIVRLLSLRNNIIYKNYIKWSSMFEHVFPASVIQIWQYE